MKSEEDSIDDDEWLIRFVWETYIQPREIPVSPRAFEPKKHELDGISLFRSSCIADPTDALPAFPNTSNHPRYAIVELPVLLFAALGLSVRKSPIEAVPGHVVIPELNHHDHQANKNRFVPIKERLAEIASEHILRRPTA